MKILALLLALFVSTAEAQIAHDATSSNPFTLVAATSASYNHTAVGTPSVALCVAFWDTTNPTGMTYGGAAMTEQTDWSAVAGGRLYYKTSPATGTQAVVSNWGGAVTQTGIVTCMTLTGTANPPFVVGANVPGSSSCCGGITNTNLSVNTLDRGSNDWLLVTMFVGPNALPETVTQTTETQMSNNSYGMPGSYSTLIVSREGAGGDGNINYTWTNATDYSGFGISIEAAPITSRIKDIIAHGMVPKRR